MGLFAEKFAVLPAVTHTTLENPAELVKEARKQVIEECITLSGFG